MSVANELVEYENYGIIPFGSDSGYVLYQNALTSQASITTDGWTVKANTLIDSNGVSLTDTTNGGLTITGSSILTAAERTALIDNGQVSITVPVIYCGDDDTEKNGSSGIDRTALAAEFLFSFDDGASRYGGFYMDANNTLVAYASSGDGSNAIYLNTADKGTECVLTLSWANGEVIVYVDGKPVRATAAGDYTYHVFNTEVFTNLRVGSRFGSSWWMTQGAVKNLIISSQPVMYPTHHQLSKGITYFGHSFVDPASSVAGASYTAEHLYRGDVTMPQCLEREFIKKGFISANIQAVGLGGGYVSDEQGVTLLSSVTAAANATDPDWFVCLIGTNDSLLTETINDFQSELDARIDELMTATSDMVLHTIPTIKTEAGKDTAAHVAKVAENNAIILGAPARWDVAKSAGQGKVFIADSFQSFGGENPRNEYFLGQLSGQLGANLHPAAKGYDQLAKDAAAVIVANLAG